MVENDSGASLILSGTAFGSLVTLVGAWIRARYTKSTATITPQPLEVKTVEDLATKEEVAQLRHDTDAKLADIEARNENEHSSMGLRLNNVEAIATKANTWTEAIHKQLSQLNNKVDQLILNLIKKAR